MALFSNVFFDTVAGIMILLILSEIVIPLWRGRPFLPSVRKFRNLIRKTKENVRKNNSDSDNVNPSRGSGEPRKDI